MSKYLGVQFFEDTGLHCFMCVKSLMLSWKLCSLF